MEGPTMDSFGYIIDAPFTKYGHNRSPISLNAMMRQYFKLVRTTNIAHDCPLESWPITGGEIAMIYIRKNHRRRNVSFE